MLQLKLSEKNIVPETVLSAEHDQISAGRDSPDKHPDFESLDELIFDDSSHGAKPRGSILKKELKGGDNKRANKAGFGVVFAHTD